MLELSALYKHWMNRNFMSLGPPPSASVPQVVGIADAIQYYHSASLGTIRVSQAGNYTQTITNQIILAVAEPAVVTSN